MLFNPRNVFYFSLFADVGNSIFLFLPTSVTGGTVMGGFLSGIGGFFESVGKDAVHDTEHLWNTAVKDAKAGAPAVATAVRSNDAANAKAGSWFDKGEQCVEHKIDQGRALLSQHGSVAGKAASDYIGFEEGVGKSLYDTGKGFVQLSNNVQALENPLELAANPGANIARLKAGVQAVEGLGKLANLTQPASWIADPQGNERMVSALSQSAKKNFEADPSEATGYVAGTIATFFIPGGGEAAAAGDVAKAADTGADAGKIADAADAANTATGAGRAAGDAGAAGDADKARDAGDAGRTADAGGGPHDPGGPGRSAGPGAAGDGGDAKFVVDDGQGGYKINKKDVPNSDKIVGQPEPRNAVEAEREVVAASGVARYDDVTTVCLGKNADKFLNGKVNSGETCPDVIGQTTDGKYRLAEAKGTDTNHALQQFQAAGDKLGAQNIKSQDLYTNKLGRGYTVDGRHLLMYDNHVVRVDGRPINVFYTR
jgi:hypothetical protein